MANLPLCLAAMCPYTMWHFLFVLFDGMAEGQLKPNGHEQTSYAEVCGQLDIESEAMGKVLIAMVGCDAYMNKHGVCAAAWPRLS